MSPLKKTKKFYQIVNAGEALFQRFGIKRVTVTEICQQAGASKMTFYRYFNNKNDLVKHVLNRWLEEGYARVAEIEAMPISFAEKIRKIIEFKNDFLSQLSDQMIAEYLARNPDLKEFLKDYEARSYQRFKQFIERAKERGEVRPDVRPELLIALADKMTEVLRNKQLAALYPDYKAFIREVNAFFAYGFVADDVRARNQE